MIKTLNVSLATLLAFAVVMLFGATYASAASITNVEFQNGDVTVQGTGGSTVNAKVRIVVGAGEVVERIQTDVISDSLAPVCTEVGGEKGLEEGTHFVDLSVKLPPNTGTYTLEVKGSGIFGAFKTVDCTSNVVGTASFGGALKVVGAGGSVGAPGLATLEALIAQLVAALAGIGNPSPATPPVANASCSALNAKLAGTMDDVYNDANIRLQGYLLSEGATIPALAAGASFGYKGPQTRAAISWFKTIKGC